MLEEAKKAQYMVYQRLQEKYGHEHPETLRSMNELADLHLELGEEDNAFSISERALEIERSIMGEEDPMTLNTLFRIGKLHYLAQRTDEAMVILGETLSKQEKLLGFDNAEVTLTRDLLNRILGERATAIKVTSDNYHTDEFDELGPPLPEFLRPKDQINSPTISLEENASSISPESDQKEITPDDDDKINKEGNSGFFQSIKKTLKIGLDPEDTSPN
jgi:hypothetical protein